MAPPAAGTAAVRTGLKLPPVLRPSHAVRCHPGPLCPAPGSIDGKQPVQRPRRRRGRAVRAKPAMLKPEPGDPVRCPEQAGPASWGNQAPSPRRPGMQRNASDLIEELQPARAARCRRAGLWRPGACRLLITRITASEATALPGAEWQQSVRSGKREISCLNRGAAWVIRCQLAWIGCSGRRTDLFRPEPAPPYRCAESATSTPTRIRTKTTQNGGKAQPIKKEAINNKPITISSPELWF
jgi:hypothetical protein